MTSSHQRREQRKKALARDMADIAPEEMRDSIVAAWVDDELNPQREQIVREFEHAAIVADFMADPEAERLVVNEQLLAWCADNEQALVGLTAAMQDGPTAETWFRAFSNRERRLTRTFSAEEGNAIIANSETRLRRVQHRIRNADTGCTCLVCRGGA